MGDEAGRERDKSVLRGQVWWHRRIKMGKKSSAGVAYVQGKETHN